ncbi:MAG TPA: hypothetical protein VML54_06125 [Candidatus Limnocylindrales bacterium]|nr:hypothetical protein [Candidatus Limnocylindrales bacterium]
MADLSGRPIFALADRTFTWDDLVLAGCLWGGWAALEAEARGGLACLARLDDAEDGGLDEDEVDSAAAEFRYDRDLEAAEDMEAWLEARGLDVDQWLESIRRRLARAAAGDTLEDALDEYPPDDEEVAEVLAAEAICSGAAGALASRLAGQAALAARAVEAGGVVAPADAEVDALVAAVDGDGLARALPYLPPGERAARLAGLARLDLLGQRYIAGLVTPEAVAAEISAHALDWVRFEVRGLMLADEAAAHEALLCIREDAMDPAEVAAQARAEVLEGDWFLESAPDPLRDRLLGASAGDVIGPVALDARFAVVRVEAKRLPSADDETIQARAARALVDRAAARETDQRVKWHLIL